MRVVKRAGALEKHDAHSFSVAGIRVTSPDIAHRFPGLFVGERRLIFSSQFPGLVSLNGSFRPVLSNPFDLIRTELTKSLHFVLRPPYYARPRCVAGQYLFPQRALFVSPMAGAY